MDGLSAMLNLVNYVFVLIFGIVAVSYTHLDVYKRQAVVFN